MKPAFFILILLAGFSLSCKATRNKKKAAARVERNLNGNWELNYITAEADLFSFEELYPGRKPMLQFDLKNNRVAGNTSCNSFGGDLKINGNKIDFTQPMAMTKMLCEGAGEEKFLQMLQKVETYSISEDNVLALMAGNVAILRFTRK